jgi:hypothetical protein
MNMINALHSTELNRLLRSIVFSSSNYYFNVVNGIGRLALFDKKTSQPIKRLGHLYITDPDIISQVTGLEPGGENCYKVELDVVSVTIIARNIHYCEVSVRFCSTIGFLTCIISLVRGNIKRRWALPKQWDTALEREQSFNPNQALDS